MRKTYFFKILFLVSFWMFAGIFYEIFQGTILGFETQTFLANGTPYLFEKSFITSLIVVFLSSVLVGSFDVLFFTDILRRKSLRTILIWKTIFYLVIIFICSSFGVMLNISHTIDRSLFHSEVLDLYFNYLSSPTFLLIMFYWSFAVISGLSILHVSDKFGQGVMLNFILGKYHRPKEEKRIFMFLDLTSSSKIAERLGAYNYSSFLKDFFYDIDDIVLETGGAIFQFVGDEVVIVWDEKHGVEDNNCIRFFFMLERKIQRLKEHYINTYGNCPEFKAGLHYGKVIITEVGGSKQDIAYHGDTVNTAARIRSLCAEVNEKLLISAELLALMENIDNGFMVESKGVFSLKGKKNVVGILAVYEKS